jgi:hypothetical protein
VAIRGEVVDIFPADGEHAANQVRQSAADRHQGAAKALVVQRVEAEPARADLGRVQEVRGEGQQHAQHRHVQERQEHRTRADSKGGAGPASEAYHSNADAGREEGQLLSDEDRIVKGRRFVQRRRVPAPDHHHLECRRDESRQQRRLSAGETEPGPVQADRDQRRRDDRHAEVQHHVR